MIILPAIDIKDGQCVRLSQGDYGKVTTYDANPVRVAQRWQAAGASWLHVVDLDGAKAAHPVNTALIRQIRAATTLHIEVGGGLRSLDAIEQILDTGVERVILGTAALNDRTLLKETLERWGERIVVGLDARNGQVAVSGWLDTSKALATELAKELCLLGVRRFIYTDIARDGMLRGPNLAAIEGMQRAIAEVTDDLPKDARPGLIASGGVSSLSDLIALKKLGVEGAIIGKALYTGDVELATAIHEIER